MKMRSAVPAVGLVVLLIALLVAFTAGCGGEATTTTASPVTSGDTTATSGATGGEPAVSEWVIPVIGVQTGPAAGWGLDAIWAAQFAADKINSEGGVRGKPIKLEIYDTSGEVDKSITAMDRVLKSKPLVMLGPVFQTMTDAAGPMAVEEGVLMLAGINIGNNGANVSPWAASLYGNTERVWKTGVQEWVKEHPEVKSVVSFYVPDNQLYEMKFTEEAFQELGIEVLGKIECTQGQLEFGPTAAKAWAMKPDGFYSVLQGAEQAKLNIELHKLGFTDGTLMAYGPGADSATLFEVGEGYLEGNYIWDMFYVHSPEPDWQALSEAYQAGHSGALPYSAVIGPNYNAVYAIKTAIEKTNATGDAAKLKEERIAIRDFLLNAKDLPGIQGNYNYDNGIQVTPVQFMQIKDNAATLLRTVTP